MIKPFAVFALLLLVFETAASSRPEVIKIYSYTTTTLTAMRFASAVRDFRKDPSELTHFLAEMPKGGDLHHHISGAVYAESYIKYAAADGDCIDNTTYAIAPPPCDAAKGLSPASRALYDYAFRNLTIDAYSARNYTPVYGDASPIVHFFQAFFKFGLVVSKHYTEELAEVAHRAGIQHEIYLETMISADRSKSMSLGEKAGWDPDFDKLRAKLDAAGMPALVLEAQKNLHDFTTGSRALLGCDTPAPDEGCGVTVRYIYPVLRDNTKEKVFAQVQLAFELAAIEPTLVAPNPVQAQDDYLPMADFTLQMRMFGYFHKLYPKVHITMHAGELFRGLQPPEEMYSPAHIRESIEIGGAERIGHGLDVLHERDSRGLLAMMARKHILVEDPIYIHELIGPGVKGEDVLPIYRNAGVPLSLATDDEGVARSDLTQTFERAVIGYHVDYYGLKQMVRASLQHGFMGGADLWTAWDDYRTMVPACNGRTLAPVPAAPACRAFLQANMRASIEWNEEVAFQRFEESH